MNAFVARGVEVIGLARRGESGTFARWELGEFAVLDRVDVLVHCAYDFRHQSVNVPGTRVLYEAARKQGVGCIVHMSSLAAFDESRSIYGRTKLAIEAETSRHGGFSIRAGTVWGGKQGGPMASLEAVVRRFPVVPSLTGCGQMRLVHIDDLARLVILSIDYREHLRGAIIGAASPDSIELSELLRLIARRAGLHRLFIPVPASIAQATLGIAELLGVTLPLRADSVRTLRFVNPAPGLLQPDSISTPMRSFLEFRSP